jgi:hypothetical protein
MDVSLMSKDVVSRFENDFNNANLIDPYIFQTFENEKYLIDFNIPAGDFFDETYRGIIVQTALETDLCETGKDITFYDNRVIVKKKKKSACKKCEIQKNSLHCAPCEIAREVLNNNNPTDETDCQWWCNRVAQTAENMCVSSFQTAACRHTCMQVVQVAKAWCHKCCHADGFYQNCVKPFENFLESVGCEDAIW